MWKPVESNLDLPALGTRESQSCDFKAKPTEDDFEIAKDVAAFANASGGTLFVGAAGGDHLAKWLPISPSESASSQRVYETAIRDRCSPAPVFTLSEVEVSGGRVFAINVWPFPGQLVGVRLKRGEARCGPGAKEPEDVYFYPQRVGTHTKSISPAQLAMFLDSRIRRIGIHLQESVGGKAILIATKYREEGRKWVQPVQVQSLDLLTNTLTVLVPIEHVTRSVPIPLDAVETVSRAIDGWHIYIAGILTSVDSGSPLLANFQTYFDPLG
ncbi:MAG: ATP-binding protein [Polyangiaceae bacterium]